MRPKQREGEGEGSAIIRGARRTVAICPKHGRTRGVSKAKDGGIKFECGCTLWMLNGEWLDKRPAPPKT